MYITFMRKVWNIICFESAKNSFKCRIQKLSGTSRHMMFIYSAFTQYTPDFQHSHRRKTQFPLTVAILAWHVRTEYWRADIFSKRCPSIMCSVLFPLTLRFRLHISLIVATILKKRQWIPSGFQPPYPKLIIVQV